MPMGLMVVLDDLEVQNVKAPKGGSRGLLEEKGHTGISFNRLFLFLKFVLLALSYLPYKLFGKREFTTRAMRFQFADMVAAARTFKQ